MNWTILAGPLIGAVIGYFTNYLAVKMLFRPRHEVRIMGKRLPFTPGVIPKGKARLARVIGKTVAENLLTKDDMSNHLLSEEMKGAVAKRAVKMASLGIKDEIIDFSGMSAAKYEEKRDEICEAVSRQIYDSVATMPIKEKVMSSLMGGIKEKLDDISRESMMGPMIAMMLTEDRIMSLIEPVADKIERYVDKHGMDYIRPAVAEKVEKLENATALDILEMLNINEAEFEKAIADIYEKVVRENLASAMKHMNLAGIIEKKINDMDVVELESMVLSVMKKELNTIVRLGALIGLVIGTLNIFIA